MRWWSTFYVLVGVACARPGNWFGGRKGATCSCVPRRFRLDLRASSSLDLQVLLIEVLQPLLSWEYMRGAPGFFTELRISGQLSGVRCWAIAEEEQVCTKLHTLADPSLLSHAGLPGTRRKVLQCGRCTMVRHAGGQLWGHWGRLATRNQTHLPGLMLTQSHPPKHAQQTLASHNLCTSFESGRRKWKIVWEMDLIDC